MNFISIFHMIPVILMLFFYLAIVVIVLYLIYKWVTKTISLKQEHNDLLREIIRKLESR